MNGKGVREMARKIRGAGGEMTAAEEKGMDIMDSLRGDVFNARESFLYEDDRWYGTLTDSYGKIVYQSPFDDDIGTKAEALANLQGEAERRGARLEIEQEEDRNSWRKEPERQAATPDEAEWRGTLSEAIAESERRAATRVAFVRADWQHQAYLWAESGDKFIAVVREAETAWSEHRARTGQGPLPRSYRVSGDGTIYNLEEMGREEYLRVQPSETMPPKLREAVMDHVTKAGPGQKNADEMKRPEMEIEI